MKPRFIKTIKTQALPLTLVAALAVPLVMAAAPTPAPVSASAPVSAPGEGAAATDSAVPPSAKVTIAPFYDTDYPFIHYAAAPQPQHNQVARLLERLHRGEIKLDYGPHGYLESFLAALDIDPNSQVLVFSKTSLQIDAINAQTPRALYFNDDTYIGFVQKTGLMEVGTMDADRGAVFYTFRTLSGPTTPHPDPSGHAWRIDREAPRCLTCHDSFAESGGGLPVFMFESAYEIQGGNVVFGDAAHETNEPDPIASRWGGWYVSGDDGGAFHLGNIMHPAHQSQNGQSVRTTVPRDEARRGAVPSLASLLDVTPYLRPSSDLVALLVLQNEVDVHNALTRPNYKSRYMFYKFPKDNVTADTHWKDMPASMQKRLTSLLDPIVRAMIMVDTAKLEAPVKGNTSYAETFQARGPRDAQGRSLRDLDLHTRVFRYPMSFLIYTESYDQLPVGVREYMQQRFVEILSGRDRSGKYNALNANDARAALDILKTTKPGFADAL